MSGATLLRPAVFAPLLVFLGAALSAWFANRGLPNPDEGAVLTAAARIARGAVFYRDVDAYWGPAAPTLLAAAMRLFGEHLSLARGLAGALYCVLLLTLYLTALQLVDRARAALFALSLLAFKFLAWPAFTAYLYSDLAFSFACVAIALLVAEGRSPARLLGAGFCVGVALAAKLNVGIFLGAAGLGVLGLGPTGRAGAWRRHAAWFTAGGMVAVAPVLAYFAVQGVLSSLATSALVRPLTGYLTTSGISFAEPLAWWNLGALVGNAAIPYIPLRLWHMLMQGQLPGWDFYPLYWTCAEVASRAAYTSVPLIFAGAGVAWLRTRGAPTPRDARRAIFAVLAFSVFLSAFPRADWFHVTSVYPLVLLLLFALVQPRAGRRRAWPEAVAVASLLTICGMLAGQYHVYLSHRLELERASVRVPPSDAWVGPLVEGVRTEVAPDEPFFVYGHEAHLYFLSGRFSPWPFAQLYPGQTGDDDGSALATTLALAKPTLMVRGLQRWTGIPEIGSYAPRLAEYVEEHFTPDPRFFEEHPLPDGLEPPPDWIASVLRARSAAPASR